MEHYDRRRSYILLYVNSGARHTGRNTAELTLPTRHIRVAPYLTEAIISTVKRTNLTIQEFNLSICTALYYTILRSMQHCTVLHCTPRFGTLMERAEVMTALRNASGAELPAAFEQRVPDNAKQVIRWLLKADAEGRPTAAELLSSPLLPPKLEVEATFLREALRVVGNPESDTFQVSFFFF